MRIRRLVPSTGWYAVAALAVVAALGAATVVGAGLSLWRGTSAQRSIGTPAAQLFRPGSGVVTVPARPARPATPATPTSTPVAPHVAAVTTHVLAVRQRHQPGPTHAAPHSPAAPPTRVPVVVKPVTHREVHFRFGSFVIAGHARVVVAPAHQTAVSVVFSHALRVAAESLVRPEPCPQPDHAAKPEHDKPEHDKLHYDADHGDDD